MKECSVFIRIGSKRPPDLLREVANIRKSINFFIRARVCHWRIGPLETGIPGLIQTSRPDQKYPLHEEMSLSLHRIFRFPHRQRQACFKNCGLRYDLLANRGSSLATPIRGTCVVLPIGSPCFVEKRTEREMTLPAFRIGCPKPLLR